MSHTQSRSQRSDSTQYRKSARSGGANQQRYDKSNLPGKGGGGGGASPAISNSGSVSFKKYGGNAQGGHPSARSPNANADSAVHSLLNHGESGLPPSSSSSGMRKDNPTPKVTRPFSSTVSISNGTTSVPVSNASTVASISKISTTTAKEDASRAFPLQFGSISPGLMDGFQIPARTTSAPPNLDEQRKSQACDEASRPAPSIPNPSVFPKKNGENLGQTVANEAQQISKPKRDTQPPVAPVMPQSQKPAVRPIPSMPMQIPFHQPQVPLQFGGPTPQMQPQALPGASIAVPFPMHLPMGNPILQQPMFIPGLQSNPVQPQGMIHQVQNFNLPAQMGHQIPAQLGNTGLSVGPHYSPQPPGKYASSRKTVKITHPETHKELKLDGAPGPRPSLNATPQSQPIPSYPPNQPMNFYPNSYSAASMFFPSSVPMNTTQALPTSQSVRVTNQVTVKPPDPLSANSSLLHGEESVRSKKEVKPLSSVSLSKFDSITVESDVTNSPPFASTTASGADCPSASAMSAIGVGSGAVVVPDSTNDKPKKVVHGQPDQMGEQPPILSSLPSQNAEMGKTNRTSSGTNFLSDTTKESLATAVADVSNLTNTAADVGNYDEPHEILENKDVNGREAEIASTDFDEQGKPENSRNLKFGVNNLEISLESQETASKIDETSERILSSFIDDKLNIKEKAEESLCCSDDVMLIGTTVETKSVSGEISGTSSAENNLPVPRNQLSGSQVVPDVDHTAMGGTNFENTDGTMKLQNEDGDKSSDQLLSPSADAKSKLASDINVGKSVVLRGRKKKKEFLRKAEAAGASSDLYMAYKGPEKKKEVVSSADSMEKISNSGTNEASAEISQNNDILIDKAAPIKTEPDDWEDAAEISPQLKSPKFNEDTDGDGNALLTKKYSRDFLLKFEGEWTNLPEGFEVTPDVAEVLVVSSFRSPRDSYPSSGRNTDRPISVSRSDYRASGLEDDEKWIRFPGPPTPGKGDFVGEIGHATNIVGLRPGKLGNFGVRNQRQQINLPYVGGIVPGPMQRTYSDSDRWQRGSSFQRGLIPSPQTPQMMMHKAERKYEVGKTTDEEEAKQRQLKAILNKLTPQNFEKLFQQVKEVNIDNVVTLSGVISQIFDKALMEPTFCEMYANFCFHLAADLPDLTIDNQKITFKRLLLNKCQEEFEKREREEEEAIKAEEEGGNKDTPEEREEKRLRVRRRMLGNIRLIGEVYKKGMLTERIMHECINKLLGQHQNPDEENIESLCKLMSTIGEIIDHQKAKVHMDAYFQNMSQLSNNPNLSSRVRFMLKDTIDLRKNKWQQRRKVEGPKKIEEVHRDAAQERHAQSNWPARSSSMGSSTRRGSHMEFGARAPSLLSPGSHLSSSHPVPPHFHGGGSQDARMDERHSHESRNAAVSLPQRPLSGDSITLGPQVGSLRGMASRPQPSTSTVGLSDISASGAIRRMGDVNGFGPEWTSYGQRADPNLKSSTERLAASSVHDQLHTREIVSSNGNREARVMDRISDRSAPVSPPAQVGPLTGINGVSLEKELPEEHLRSKSLAAIKEFYSGKDKNEVVLCIKELDAPSFHPSMISIWVCDSFEQKDAQRDLLTDLLISISQPQVGILSDDQLIRGFESVLSCLEDAVNDAPRATEFLGRIFGRLISDNVVAFSEISRLVYEGGEEPGGLRETGLAAEVISSLLDAIKSEKGDAVLNEMRSNSGVRLEGFRPPGNKRSRLDKFI